MPEKAVKCKGKEAVYTCIIGTMRLASMVGERHGRRMVRHVFFCVFIVISTVKVFAADEVTDAGKTAAAFYDRYLSSKVSSGVPTRSQLASLKPVVSKELFSLLESANKAERYYKKKNRGNVPPLVEGDLFTSLFEGAVSYELKPCETKKGLAQCLVTLKYVDPGDKSVVSWNDRLFLVKAGSRWLVDDIEYLGDWQFMHKGRLKSLLQQVLKDSRE